MVRFQVAQGGGDSIQLVEQFVSCQAVHDVSAGYMHRGLRHEVILLVVDELVMLLVVCQSQRHARCNTTLQHQVCTWCTRYVHTHVPGTGIGCILPPCFLLLASCHHLAASSSGRLLSVSAVVPLSVPTVSVSTSSSALVCTSSSAPDSSSGSASDYQPPTAPAPDCFSIMAGLTFVAVSIGGGSTRHGPPHQRPCRVMREPGSA